MIAMAQQRIIWFAIVFSSVIYLVIAFMIAPDTSGGFDEVASRQPIPILYAAALGVFLFAWFVARKIVRAKDPKTRLIVSLALFESCAIMGLVAAMVGKDWRLYLAPWVLALIGFIGEFPRGIEADRAQA